MNLTSILTATAARRPDAVALRSGDEVMTYGAVALEAGLLAGGLERAGIAPGERVGIACPNGRRFVVAYLAVLHAGAVAVPLNPGAPAPEMVRELNGVGARLLVAAPSVATALSGADGLDGVTVVAAGRDGGAAWDALFAGTTRPMVDRQPQDLAVLIYTSGTSGAPKAAMLSHANLSANIGQVQDHPGIRLEPSDVVLAVLPLFHIFGLNVVLGVGLAAGAEVVLVEHFDPVGTSGLVRQRRVTMVAGAPPMFGAWLAHPEVAPDSFSSVRLAVSGAAPLPVEIQRGFQERFGVQVFEGYGLTEASPIVTSSAVAGHAHAGSIGPPLPGVDVRLVDADGADVLAGDPGELWVRGPNVFLGYWDDAASTARVLGRDGWLHTGDVAVAADDGCLTIVDRAKDLIIVSGFNVFPAEVEEVLAAHPSVAEVAVVGIPDARTGEAVHAYVVARPGAEVVRAELIGFCARQLARYKCPSSVTVVDALPHGLGGKLLRRALREHDPAQSG